MYDINLKKQRLAIVSLFYRYYVLKYRKDEMKQDIIGEKQMVLTDENLEKYLLDLADQNEAIQHEIEAYLKDNWSWERLPNLVKACLVEGVFEIKNTTIDKAITINEMTEIVKTMQPDWDYGFVNAVLDKFNKA